MTYGDPPATAADAVTYSSKGLGDWRLSLFLEISGLGLLGPWYGSFVSRVGSTMLKVHVPLKPGDVRAGTKEPGPAGIRKT